MISSRSLLRICHDLEHSRPSVQRGLVVLIEVPRGRGLGTWHATLCGEEEGNPRWVPTVECPVCGEKLFAVNHHISKDGWVSPSLGHPRNVSCAWHTNPKLLGWSDLPPVPPPREEAECERCHRKARSIGGWGIGWGYKLVCRECVEELSN